LFANEALVKLLSLPETDPMHSRARKEFILMTRIDFPKFSGRMLRWGEVLTFEANLCCELGVYGTILTDVGQEDGESGAVVVLHNTVDGTLVRTKPADMDDGGVMAGVAALDSLAIVDE
jgi:glutathione synthase